MPLIIMNNQDFNQPQRQSWRGLILFFSISLKNIIKALWPAIILLLLKQNSLDDSQLYLIWFAIAFLFLLIVANTVMYFMNFYFYIKESELIIEKGFFKKVKIIIPLDKIQSINTKQSILQQLLKVVSLEIDTAGSSQKEAKFISLNRETAERLQGLLSEYKGSKYETPESQLSESSIHEKTILKLNFWDLFKIGLSENHLKSLLVIYLFLSGIYQQLKDLFSNRIEDATNQAGGILENSGAVFITLLLIISLLLLIAFSVFMVILRYYNLQFTRQENAFLLKSGLLNKKDILLPYSKIQLISWNSNPIRKIMDFVSVHITQASNIDLNKKQAIIIPGCNKIHLERIKNEIFINLQDESWSTHKSHNMFFIRLWVIRIFVLSIPLILIIPDYWETYIFVCFWIIISGVFTYFSYKKRFLKISKNYLQISKGCIGKEFSMMSNYKVQMLKLNQNFFQKRRKTATVTIYTSGSKKLIIPYLQENIAYDLYNYLLFVTESTERNWM